jgi:hypothetical protein
MCRYLCYKGPELLLSDLLYRPKNSLILQSYKSRERKEPLNGDGSRPGHDSRSWRWSDIRSVGRSDIYRFDVETFEPQLGASSRSFNFILKEQMADKIYDLIWSRVYRPTPLISAEKMSLK